MKYQRQPLRSKASPKKKSFAKKLRRNMTLPERVLWSRLKDKQIGVWIYPQSIIFGYIVDFWYPGGIVIEVDGPIHLLQKAKDAFRDKNLLNRGIRTMRFTAEEVINNTNAVVSIVTKAIGKVKN